MQVINEGGGGGGGGSTLWPSAGSPQPRLANTEHILVYLATISIIGTLGNLLVVIVYARKRDKQTSTFFILVLALSDLAVCSILVPFTAYMEHVVFATTSTIMCKLYFFLATTTVPNSSLLMLAIAFDRYFCICLVSRTILNLPRARVLVLVLVFISTLLGVIPSLSSAAVEFPEFYNQSANSTELLAGDVALMMNETFSSHAVCAVDVDMETPVGQLVWQFKFFYDLVYACSVLVITLLYGLIYKEIYVRRRMKRTRKEELLRNGCLVLTAGGGAHGDEAAAGEHNSINRVIAIASPARPMAGGRAAGVAHHQQRNEQAVFRPRGSGSVAEAGGRRESRNRASLKKCYCYFENNTSKYFVLSFLCLEILSTPKSIPVFVCTISV
jgi:hypothetical protein